MKFRPSATITIYCLFTILFSSLFNYASDVEQNSDSDIMPELKLATLSRSSDQNLQFPTNKCELLHGIKKQIFTLQEKYEENTNLIPSLQRALISSELQQNFRNRLQLLKEVKKQIYSLQQKLPAYKLLNEIKKDILSYIFNQFLTIQDILILRQTSKYFQILLQPNEQNMVMFCKDFSSKEIEEVSLIWLNLKYFLKQSYMNALDQMEIFKIKTEFSKNQYAVITRTNDKKIISWYNNERISHDTLLPIQYEPPTIYSTYKKAWAKITNLETGGKKMKAVIQIMFKINY